MIYLFYDYETTGFSAKMDSLLEIAAVVVNSSFKVVDEFQTFVDPQKRITEKITEITGIDNETVRNAPTQEMAFKAFAEFVNKYKPDIIAGHNIISFDNKWTDELTGRYKISFHQPTQYIDTLAYFKDLGKKGALPGYNYTTASGNPSYKLEHLINYYNLGAQSHRAIDDVYKNIAVYKQAKLEEAKSSYGF